MPKVVRTDLSDGVDIELVMFVEQCGSATVTVPYPFEQGYERREAEVRLNAIVKGPKRDRQFLEWRLTGVEEWSSSASADFRLLYVDGKTGRLRADPFNVTDGFPAVLEIEAMKLIDQLPPKHYRKWVAVRDRAVRLDADRAARLVRELEYAREVAAEQGWDAVPPSEAFIAAVWPKETDRPLSHEIHACYRYFKAHRRCYRPA